MKVDDEVCDEDRLSIVNNLNGKELKLWDSHIVVSGNSGKELWLK